jgi:myosin heavy subunit
METKKNIPTDSTAGKSSWKNVLLWFLVVALLATWTYMLWDKNRVEEETVERNQIILTTNQQKDQLMIDLKDVSDKYEAVKKSGLSKDSVIYAQNRDIRKKADDIRKKQERIEQILKKQNATEAELKEAKALIASLEQDVRTYETELQRLQSENSELMAENKKVTDNLDRVQKDLTTSQSVVSKQQETIQIASTLHASTFGIIGLKEKKGGREKETTTAKRVDKIRISFIIDENKVTTSGQKELFISIKDPQGKTITGPDAGKLTLQDGSTIDFTQQLTINYIQNQSQAVSFDWRSSEDFSIGEYQIDVYNNGFKIGQGKVSLKKGGLFR